MLLLALGIVAGLVSYVFGGLGKALSISGKIAFWGWVVVPFPADLVTFVFSFVFALMAFVLLPIIPVRKAYLAYGK